MTSSSSSAFDVMNWVPQQGYETSILHPVTDATFSVFRVLAGLCIPLGFGLPLCFATPPTADSVAIAELKAGKRDTADPCWWGFNRDDATDALQAAINSGAKKVTVPFMGQPWIVRPIRLRSHLELVFEPGVIVLAKKGEFRGGGDSLFSGLDLEDITIRGYGAMLRMHKTDYQHPPYVKAEWRMGIGLYGCRRVRIAGLRIESTGGDGLMLGSGSNHRPCEEIAIRNCVCHDNHRQGISVVNADKIVVENCIFSGTWGTPPEAGIDLEPDLPEERVSDCVIRNCRFENNAGHEILVYLNRLSSKSQTVSILFDHCVCRMGQPGMTPDDFHDPALHGWAGMAVGTVHDDSPKGLVEFRDCIAENTGREGAKIYDKSASGVKVRFVNCSWKSCWVSRAREYTGPRVPLLIELRGLGKTTHPGGVDFVDCHVYDDIAGPAIDYEDATRKTPLADIAGQITVHGRGLNAARLGPNAVNVTLRVLDAP
jgi:parallel beta-helix repeat protein